SCGAIRSIIPNLIRCGVDIIETLQNEVGLEVEGLKKDFGDKLCFQGGVDTQGVLPFGTPQEVQEETEHIIRVLGEGGGYILAPSQDFEGDVPVENILALYKARGKL
ncbi:MAG: uroporphyrinogen decarboxylase family protein, partial [Ruthenibacterium sp.]